MHVYFSSRFNSKTQTMCDQTYYNICILHRNPKTMVNHDNSWSKPRVTHANHLNAKNVAPFLKICQKMSFHSRYLAKKFKFHFQWWPSPSHLNFSWKNILSTIKNLFSRYLWSKTILILLLLSKSNDMA